MANSLTLYLGISVALIFLIFIVDYSMGQIAEEEGLDNSKVFFNYDDSHIKDFDKGNYTIDERITNNLPTGAETADVTEDGGNIFTDTFKTIKNWLLDLPGVRTIIKPLTVVPNFLKNIFPGDFAVFAFAIGYLWQASVIASLVMWLKGGAN